MKVAWLAPLDVVQLEPELQLARRLECHSCSWIVNLSRALAQMPDIDLHLVTESPLVHKNTAVVKNGITYHIIKSGIPFTNRGYPVYCNLDLLRRFRPNINRIAAYLNMLKPDILHAYGTENSYALAALNSGFPTLISMQGIINIILKDSTGLHDRLRKELELAAVKQMTFVDCRTNLDTGFIASQNPQAKIFTIHRAIHPAYFESKWTLPKDKKLLFVGTVIQRKGIEVLLEALGIVKKQIPEVALNVAGMVEEAYKNELIDKCRRLGLEDVIRFLGHQSAEQIADLHLESRLMAFPSFIDNSPNSVAEAMVSGLPIVASRVGGIPSMIEHDKTGLLVEPADSEALAESIIELLENDAKCLALSQSAQQIAFERYHPQKVATAAINAYKFILEQKIVLRESA